MADINELFTEAEQDAIASISAQKIVEYLTDNATRMPQAGGKIFVGEDDGSIVVPKVVVTNGTDRTRTIEPFTETISAG